MADVQLKITAEECEYLVGLLQSVLKERKIEEHRTRAPEFRKHVIHQEELIVSLLNKLGRPTT